MQTSVAAQKNPSKIQVEKGKTYYWCACGLSQKQPFCDGSHKKEGNFKSIKYMAQSDKVVFFCNCKLTKNPLFCDNSHIKL